MSLLTVLNAVLSIVIIVLTFALVGFCAIMAVGVIYYSFIKRAALLFCMGRKLKKIAKQQLGHQEREMKGQSLMLDTGISALSFKQSLPLSKKDYKRIFWISLFLFVLSVVGSISGMYVVPKLISDAEVDNLLLFSLYLLPFVVWACIALFLPLVLVFYTLLNYRLKNMIQKLECN
ncbi:hypothetical protein ACRPOS_007515 [Bartonella heixiaziensis]|uniref:hypothetical protein n=1 Tax=Bartonella heixiaziensis TaxID=1461000 RepID=UPI003908B6C6